MELVYKVVNTVNGKRYSAIVCGAPCVTYTPGQQVSGPRGTPLFVFAYAEAAREFMATQSRRQQLELWVAAAAGLREPPAVRLQTTAASLHTILRFWQAIRRGTKRPRLPVMDDFPWGTRLADSVQLVVPAQSDTL